MPTWHDIELFHLHSAQLLELLWVLPQHGITVVALALVPECLWKSTRRGIESIASAQCTSTGACVDTSWHGHDCQSTGHSLLYTMHSLGCCYLVQAPENILSCTRPHLITKSTTPQRDHRRDWFALWCPGSHFPAQVLGQKQAKWQSTGAESRSSHHLK
ncbi:hypothetical protein DUNSADRAFT_4282 [Dunaliella salina]|uniref:Encoded protein n=1 Tax=Dunaliella salina TaxID=3046 RepID=A0ABQ7GSD1_DUNSA|nr:hypothetical protein DUNSADRAFT_4282 [Dunaliella salina]|eukprot:KAF5837480.1 hypothetical protein DUNSADRAFT_4282 [Dunaliella salina]